MNNGTSSAVNAPLSSGRLARAYVSMALPRRSGTSFATDPGSHPAAMVPPRSTSVADMPARNTSLPPCRTQASTPWSTAGSKAATERPQTMIESAPSKAWAVRPRVAAPPAPDPFARGLIATTRGRVLSSLVISREARSAAGRSPSTSITDSVAGIAAGTDCGTAAASPPTPHDSSTSTRGLGRPKRTVSRATGRPSGPVSTAAAGDRTNCPSGSSTHTRTASGSSDADVDVGNSSVSGVHEPVR